VVQTPWMVVYRGSGTRVQQVVPFRAGGRRMVESFSACGIKPS